MLSGRFFQKALGNYKADVLAGKQDLGEAVLYATQTVGDVLEATAVKDRLLNASNKAKAEMLGDFTNLTEEREVKDKIVVFAGPQILKEFVHNEKNALVRVNLCKRRHHFFESRLVIYDFVSGRKSEAHTMLFKENLELLCDDVSERHLAGYLDPVNFEFPCNCACSFSDFRMADHRNIGRVLRYQRKHRHKVRLTSSVVTDNQHAFMIHGLVE